MKFSRDEIRRAMLLYAVTDRSWLREGESLSGVCREVLKGGATFLQIREKDLDEASFELRPGSLRSSVQNTGFRLW